MFSRERLIGTYKLLSHSQINSELNGLIMYTPDGFMSVNITGKWIDDKGSKDIHIAYAGTYAIEGEFVIHNVDVFDNPKRERRQPRHAQFINQQMILTDGTENSPYKIVWEKIETPQAQSREIELAQLQLEAYNKFDLELFCTYYHPEVSVRRIGEERPFIIGLKDFKQNYQQLFQKYPGQNCQLLSRKRFKSFVVDEELVTGDLNIPMAFMCWPFTLLKTI